MKKGLFIFSILLISCNSSSKKNEVPKVKEELVMYNPSELTLLMEEMYQYNDSIKVLIENGILPKLQFPDRFLEIHTAEMTSTFERDESYRKYANTFILFQKKIHNSTSENIQDNFNNTINLCIGCHQTSCAGPIPRIQKLLIK